MSAQVRILQAPIQLSQCRPSAVAGVLAERFPL